MKDLNRSLNSKEEKRYWCLKRREIILGQYFLQIWRYIFFGSCTARDTSVTGIFSLVDITRVQQLIGRESTLLPGGYFKNVITPPASSFLLLPPLLLIYYLPPGFMWSVNMQIHFTTTNTVTSVSFSLHISGFAYSTRFFKRQLYFNPWGLETCR